MNYPKAYEKQLPMIYIAGPYTHVDPLVVEQNILMACVVAAEINLTGLAWAVVPHLQSHLIKHSLPEKQWRGYTMQLLRRSEAVLFTAFANILGQPSNGTSDENTECLRLKKPSFMLNTAVTEMTVLKVWLQSVYEDFQRRL